MLITALLTVRTAWKQSGGLSGWEGQCNETPAPQVPAAQTQVQDAEPGAGGGLTANGEQEGSLRGGLAQCSRPNCQKEHSSEESHAAQDTSSPARSRGQSVFSQTGDTLLGGGGPRPTTRPKAQRPRTLSPVEAGQPGDTGGVRSWAVAPGAGRCPALSPGQRAV